MAMARKPRTITKPRQPKTIKSDAAVIIDDKGLFVTRRDGSPVSPGAKILFRYYTAEQDSGYGVETVGVWECHRGGLLWTFATSQDLLGWCADNDVRLEVVPIGANIRKWMEGLR